MGICPLTQRMCVKLGRHTTEFVCYEGEQIRRIKDLRLCPMQVTIERPPVQKFSHIGN